MFSIRLIYNYTCSYYSKTPIQETKMIIFKIYRIIAKLIYKLGLFYFRTPRRIHKAILRTFSDKNYVLEDGFKVFTDKNDDDDFFIYGFKKHNDIKKVIEQYVKKGDVTIDIGANVGKISLLLSKQVGDNGKVFSFEPEQTNYNTIQKNIEINNIKNIQVIQKAVTDKTEQTFIEISHASTGHQIISKPNEKTKQIESISLDDYFINQKIDFVKIDAEGSESKILKGMINLINSNPEIKIAIEYNTNILKQTNKDPIEYVLDLKAFGFQIFDMMREEMTDEFMLLENYKKEPHLTNLLCFKESKTTAPASVITPH